MVDSIESKIIEIQQRLRSFEGSLPQRSTVERAVKQRMKACGFASADEYREHLGNSTTELQELIEGVVVPETSNLRAADSE